MGKRNLFLSFPLMMVMLFLAIAFSSCSSSTTVSFLCNNRDLQIYVNDTYIGQELVTYTAPKGVTTADIQCKKDGITVYTKSIYIKGYNRHLFEINVPDNNSYSSDRQIHSK